MNPHYPLVSERASHRCEYCRAPEAIFNFSFEVEHITPLSQSGDDTEANLALACRACNIRKSDYVTGMDETTQSEAPLFNPRQEQWEDHFQPNIITGEIRGLTSVGRATVTRLRINSGAQVVARLSWIQLGLFP